MLASSEIPMSAKKHQSLPEVAARLAAALEGLLDRGYTDDEGRFVILPSEEESSDEESGITEITEAQEALRAYRALRIALGAPVAPATPLGQRLAAKRCAYTWYVLSEDRTVCAVHAEGIGLDAAEAIARRLAASYNVCLGIPLEILEEGRLSLYRWLPEGEEAMP